MGCWNAEERKTEKEEWGDSKREERDRGVGGEDERGSRRSSYGDSVSGQRSENRISSEACRVNIPLSRLF